MTTSPSNCDREFIKFALKVLSLRIQSQNQEIPSYDDIKLVTEWSAKVVDYEGDVNARINEIQKLFTPIQIKKHP